MKTHVCQNPYVVQKLMEIFFPVWCGNAAIHFYKAMQTLRTNKKFIRIAALQSGLQPNRKPLGNTFNKVCEKERQFSTVNVFKKYSVIGTKSVKKVSKI